METKSFIERIADTIGSSINNKIIFGAPIEKEGLILIPVSRIRYGFGAGYGRSANTSDDNANVGRGAGGGVDARPIGYIQIKEGEATFKSISNPISIPAVILAGGFASLFIFRGLSKLFRR